jgi:hypothetical protein
MTRRKRLVVVAVAAALPLALCLAACSGTPVSPEPTRQSAPASYAEYADGFCSAMGAMVRAIGNPDTGADSDLSFALEQAIERGDIAAATEAAGKIRTELQAARQEASRIAGWSEGADVAKHLDRFLAAFDVYIATMLSAAPQGLGEAQAAAQQASEGEGALEAWMGMLEGVRDLASRSGDPTALDCGIPPDPRNPDQ